VRCYKAMKIDNLQGIVESYREESLEMDGATLMDWEYSTT